MRSLRSKEQCFTVVPACRVARFIIAVAAYTPKRQRALNRRRDHSVSTFTAGSVVGSSVSAVCRNTKRTRIFGWSFHCRWMPHEKTSRGPGQSSRKASPLRIRGHGKDTAVVPHCPCCQKYVPARTSQTSLRAGETHVKSAWLKRSTLCRINRKGNGTAKPAWLKTIPRESYGAGRFRIRLPQGIIMCCCVSKARGNRHPRVKGAQSRSHLRTEEMPDFVFGPPL